jgi:hypothetical protein
MIRWISRLRLRWLQRRISRYPGPFPQLLESGSRSPDPFPQLLESGSKRFPYQPPHRHVITLRPQDELKFSKE